MTQKHFKVRERYMIFNLEVLFAYYVFFFIFESPLFVERVVVCQSVTVSRRSDRSTNTWDSITKSLK